MKLSSGRRRFVAAFSAFGIGALAGAAPARAEVGACSVSKADGTEENGEPNYDVTADVALFAYLTPIEAIGEEIAIYDAVNKTGRKQAMAAIKCRMERAENGTIGIKIVHFEFPLTVLERDGNYYGLVQMAYEQNAAMGLNFMSGDTLIGGFTFEKEKFEANSTTQAFDGNAALTLYSALTQDAPFRVELVAGGQAYSAIKVDTAAFRAFVNDTIMAEMARMEEMDQVAPCETSIYDPLLHGDDEYVGCFLTTACCTVVGLPDDCWELASLRRFRDGWMSGFAAGRADIERYYREAPAVAARLLASGAGRSRLLSLYWRVIVPAALCSRLGLNRLAYRSYRRMMVDLLGA